MSYSCRLDSSKFQFSQNLYAHYRLTRGEHTCSSVYEYINDFNAIECFSQPFALSLASLVSLFLFFHTVSLINNRACGVVGSAFA